MEGRGLLDGVYINNPVQGCLVRGISDLLDNKGQTDKDGCQKIAADAASAVMFELLHTLAASDVARGKTAEPVRDDVPDVRVADDHGVRSMFEDGERDRLLPLLAAGKLQAWARRGHGFPPLSVISGDHWNSHFLEYHSAPTGGINQTFLRPRMRPYESDYYDVHLNREQLRHVWNDRLDFVPLLEAARIVFDETKDTMSAGMARAEGDNEAALRWYCNMLIGVKGDGVTHLMELSGTRPPSRVREPISYDRPPPHVEIRNGAAVLVELPSRRVVAEDLMVPVSSIGGAVSFISGLDESVRGIRNTIVNSG